MKRVVLCADDFAMTEGISRGILELAEAGRISATSAMTNAPSWRDRAADLRRFAGRIGCGLHLNLTAGEPLGPMPVFAPQGRFPALGHVIRSALARRLPQDEIEAEIGRQVEAFATHCRRMPDFVDGHQHVHVLPGIRRALLRVLSRAGLAGKIWLRDPSDRVSAIVARRSSMSKAFLVSALASGFAAQAAGAGFAVNEGFSGFSDFADRPLGVDFARFLTALGPRPLLMCHPGHVDGGEAGLDDVVWSRPRELAYLASPDFAELLAARSIVLSPNL